MGPFIARLVRVVVVTFCSLTLCHAQNLIENGSFEGGTDGWRGFWSRSGTGRATIVESKERPGKSVMQLEHTAARDWSLDSENRLAVRPGQIYRLSGSFHVQGEGSVTLAVTLRDARDKVIDWAHGASTSRKTDSWRDFSSRFVIPRGAASMVPRIMGNGPATVLADDLKLVPDGDLAALREPRCTETWTLGNESIEVSLNLGDASLRMLDRRTGRTWRTYPSDTVVLSPIEREPQKLRLGWLDTPTLIDGEMLIELGSAAPEVSLSFTASGEMNLPIAFPAPWHTDEAMDLILPVNEGIRYPVDDTTIDPMRYILYGGHGLCMPWYGITAGRQGVMTIVNTPDDAAVRVPRVDGRLTLAPQWQPQKGRFGPSRKMMLVLLDDGGYVAMCKRFRLLRAEQGLLRTLAEKQRENPHVDKLVGAVNVWCWDKDAVGICRKLVDAGIDRVLWSRRAAPESIRQLNKMGVLTSRYDIYQDSMDPANFPRLRGIHPDWTSDAWPHDLMMAQDGRWTRGWKVKAKDGAMIPCGVLCDSRAVAYAEKRIPAELATHPYRSRFIDTTTAAPWRECYHPDHPLTRSQSRQAKMELLQYISRDCRLVTGSETGHEAAVPYLHYFEGMMSLGPYRVPDAGRNMSQILNEVPERVAKFQTGHYYRLPLWELVYHDCVVSYWYWGDYNNKLPALWDRRDLLNALYGTPPMFMFNAKLLTENLDRFVQSYHDAATVARTTGYSEMLSHEWLSEDCAIQQTRFAGGQVVTVNFGDTAFNLPSGERLQPLSYTVRSP